MCTYVTRDGVKAELKNGASPDYLSWTESERTNRICQSCHFLLTFPHQSECCGTRICGNCSKKLNESFKCPECGESDCRTNPDTAHRKDLDKQLMNCPLCDKEKSISFKQLERHIETHRRLKCDFCQEMFVFEKQRDKHQRGECKNRKVYCQLESFGCSEAISYDKLDDHNRTMGHQISITTFILWMKRQNNHGQVKLPIRSSLKEQDQQYLKEIFGKLGLLIGETEPMIETCSRLDSQRQAMMTKITETRTKVEQIKELSSNSAKLLENLYQILVTMQQILDEIKSKLGKGLKMLSQDGTYIDKINFNSINDGETIKSGVIYSSQSGYAFELIYEIFTDTDKKRYLSISITILKGEFDAILSWPMEYPMKLSILDVTSAKNHIVLPIDSSKLEMFNKPVDNSNPPYRIPRSCTVDTLEKGNSYKQDGFVFVQLDINFTAPEVNTIPTRAMQKPIEDYIHRNIVEKMT